MVQAIINMAWLEERLIAFYSFRLQGALLYADIGTSTIYAARGCNSRCNKKRDEKSEKREKKASPIWQLELLRRLETGK